MATLDADRVAQEMERAVQHGRLIKERRLDLGLKRPAFVAEVARHGEDMTPDYLNKIESGARALANTSPALREAIRAVLGYSAEEWQELTGLYTPAADTPARKGPPVPPVVPFRETPVSIPRELQEMIEQHGDQYPMLRDPTIQRIIAAPRNFGGPDAGPQTAEDWFEYWMVTKRYIL